MIANKMAFGGLLTLSGIIGAAQAQAAVSFSYGTDSPAYTAAGSPAAVTVYLQETLSGGSTDVVAPDGGLSGAGFAINLSSSVSSAASFSGSATEDSGFVNANSYTFYPTNSSPKDAVEVSLLASPGNYPELTEVTPTFYRVPIATLYVDGGLGTTTFSLTSIDNDTISGGSGAAANGGTDQGQVTGSPNGADYDLGGTAANSEAFTGADAAPATIFTVAVPEPASIAILMVGALAGCARRRRK